MFDKNFSFDGPRSPSIGSSSSATRDSSRSVSPCSTSVPFPMPRLSVTDLAAQFADQRIRKESAICYDSCEAYANNDSDAGWSIPSMDEDDLQSLSRARTFPMRAQSPSRRTQRQLNTRLLCSASHHQDVAALVARMVDEGVQCSITPSGSTSPTRTEDEDEGYKTASDVDMVLPASRRSSVAPVRPRMGSRTGSDLRSGGAHVNKNIRQRKDRSYRRVRSSEQQS